jgi:hypothetical protein
VFFISNHLATAREQMAWHAGSEKRAAERRKAKDAADTQIASRLAGQWGGHDGAKQLWESIHARGSQPPVKLTHLRLAVATLEGRLDAD